MPEIDEEIIKATAELMEKGYDEEIEEKLKKMGYSEKQIEEIFYQAKTRLDEKKERVKRWKLICVIASIIVIFLSTALIAYIQTLD